MKMVEYKIQSIIFPKESSHWQCRDLFYHGSKGYLNKKEGSLSLSFGQCVDFTTYLNACSYGKWRTYTNGGKAAVYLEMEGDFQLCFLGYTKDVLTLRRSEYGTEDYHTDGRQMVRFDFPENTDSLLGFEINPLGRCTIYGGYYTLQCGQSDLRDVTLCIATTTCRKEKFIRRNVELLSSELIAAEEDAGRNTYIHVVDNGRTLTEKDIHGEHVYLHPNHNVGGSGGFARGMIESLHQTPKATHVLLMDDDVLVLPESIARTYNLLRLLRPEYKDHFISGAMMYYEDPIRQHEDIGVVMDGGSWQTLKPRYDHNWLDSNLDNERDFVRQKREYAGWWCCCIPVSVIEKHGLPMPFFIRYDDVEYSLRCKAKIITMNSLCVWHVGFTTKYNAAFDRYQHCRNILIAKASSDALEGVNADRFVRDAFRSEMLKFNYDAAELVLRGIEDFIKGPEFLETSDGEKIVQNNMKLNDKLIPLDDIEDADILDVYSCYGDPPRKSLTTWLYRLTYNGHRFWPRALSKKEYAYIAFDHTYQPSKMAMHDRLVAVNPFTRTGIVRTIDKTRYREIMKRYRKAMRYYKRNRSELEARYRQAQPYLTSEAFWRKYLGI